MTANFPSIVPAAEDWTLRANTQTFTSDLTGVTQTASLDGTKWMAQVTMPPLFGRDARSLAAFIASLGGQAGRFYYGPTDAAPNGTAQGSGTVNGASQSGNSLVTAGWTAGQPELFAPGDYIEVNGQLLIITASVASDSSGNATLSFAPKLRKSPADGASIITANPTCLMKLTADTQAHWQISIPMQYAFTLQFEEALDG